MPKAARVRVASPPAGTALAPRYGLPAAAHQIMRRDSRPECNVIGDECQHIGDEDFVR